MQGIKRKRRCQNQCDEHHFSLKNLKNNSKYDIKLTFCPKYQRQPLPPQHTFAEYNNDGLFYTSAFVLGVDKKAIAKNLQKEMLDHQKLIKQNCEKYNQIVFPRPNSKHTTCSVCKETYKNYYLHIFSDEHAEKIQASPYNVFIKQLCGLFKHLWEGCEEKADEDALNSSDRHRTGEDKKGSDELNLDDILQQEDIDENPSRISRFLENDDEEEESAKEVVMRRPVRAYEPHHVQRTQKVYQDRQSRKKSINFAAFFDDEPKKKVINDHREAVSITSKKTHKTPSITETKSKEKVSLKKTNSSLDDDPFIIEYNARSKRKQKKSYYYIKKKERLEKEMREREINLKQELHEDSQQQEKASHQSEQQQEINFKQQQENFKEEQIQNNISKSQEEEYEKYLDQFHEDEKKNKSTPDQFKKEPPFQLKLFEEVEKKHYSNPLFQTLTKPNLHEIQNPINLLPTQTHNKINPSETISFISKTQPPKKAVENGSFYQLPLQKKQNINNEQKQQIIDKNKNTQNVQNELPIFHKFKNPTDKDTLKDSEPKLHRPTLQVFNEYEQKIREYQKQKDYYNGKNKITQKNLFQEKVNPQISSLHDESTVKMGRSLVTKGLEESYNYDAEKSQNGQPGELKIETYNGKYNNFPENYYKKPNNEKDVESQMTMNPVIPNMPYPGPPQFYPPYGYPVSPYAYPLHEPQKGDRPTLKYGEHRQNETYDRGGYYYGTWQHPYYLPPPGPLMPGPGSEVESRHKDYGSFAYNSSKTNESKQVLYPPYPPYPGYPPTAYPPGYYHPPGTSPYVPNQRGQYPHGQPNMRGPQPNTNININFPMYLPPYHGHYQYPPNPQRYPGQPSPSTHQGPYSSTNQSQMKASGSSYPSYGSGGLSSLPPYAQYQEYKKRENERRR